MTYTEFFEAPPVQTAGHVPQPFNAFAAADGHGLVKSQTSGSGMKNGTARLKTAGAKKEPEARKSQRAS